jgi:hypothetical protein
MTKSKFYWAFGALALAGVSYAALHDPQPTTHNGLVRIPTGDAQTDFDNALEDAKEAQALHEEARMNGDFAKASYYQEAAEAAIAIGNKASTELNDRILDEYNE